MTTTETTTVHATEVKHASHRDPFLGRVVHEYLVVCTCDYRGRVTGDEVAARIEAHRHGRAGI